MYERQAILWSCGGERLWAYPYGDNPADLRLTLTDVQRPYAVTALLCACLKGDNGQELTLDDIWSWDLTSRLQGLLGIAVSSLGQGQAAEVCCSHCGESLDMELDLAGFAAIETPESVTCVPSEKTRLRLRAPTGNDQCTWLQRWRQGAPNPADLAASLVTEINDQSPVQGWMPDTDWLNDIEQALEQMDPLTGLTLETRCPECGTALSEELDLEKFVLHRLGARRECLLDEVHTLALVYHWSEMEIFNLPAERRRAYLRRIDGEDWL